MKNNFIGEWSLISMTNEIDNKIISTPNGNNLKGLLIYNETGTMSAQLGNFERSKFKSNDFRYGLTDEIIPAFNGFISYFGTYSINEEKSYIVHNVEMSLFPNWIGTKVKRYYEFKDNLLILRATPILENGIEVTPTLKWERRI